MAVEHPDERADEERNERRARLLNELAAEPRPLQGELGVGTDDRQVQVRKIGREHIQLALGLRCKRGKETLVELGPVDSPLCEVLADLGGDAVAIFV